MKSVSESRKFLPLVSDWGASLRPEGGGAHAARAAAGTTGTTPETTTSPGARGPLPAPARMSGARSAAGRWSCWVGCCFASCAPVYPSLALGGGLGRRQTLHSVLNVEGVGVSAWSQPRPLKWSGRAGAVRFALCGGKPLPRLPVALPRPHALLFNMPLPFVGAVFTDQLPVNKMRQCPLWRHIPKDWTGAGRISVAPARMHANS